MAVVDRRGGGDYAVECVAPDQFAEQPLAVLGQRVGDRDDETHEGESSHRRIETRRVRTVGDQDQLLQELARDQQLDGGADACHELEREHDEEVAPTRGVNKP